MSLVTSAATSMAVTSLAQRGGDDLLFGAGIDMAVGKRGSSPGQFSAAEGISRLDQLSPAGFLVTLGAEMSQDQFAHLVIDENRTAVHGHVHARARAIFLAGYLVCF